MAIKYFHPLLANIMCVRWNPERPDWIQFIISHNTDLGIIGSAIRQRVVDFPDVAIWIYKCAVHIFTQCRRHYVFLYIMVKEKNRALHSINGEPRLFVFVRQSSIAERVNKSDFLIFFEDFHRASLVVVFHAHPSLFFYCFISAQHSRQWLHTQVK